MRSTYKKFKYFLVIALLVPFLNGCSFDFWRTKSDIPANFTIADTVFFTQNWTDFCYAGLYNVSDFDFNNLDLVAKGFHSFEIGTVLDNVPPNIIMPFGASQNLSFVWDFCIKNSEFRDIYLSMVNSEDMIFSYHSGQDQFLLYDKERKILINSAYLIF